MQTLMDPSHREAREALTQVQRRIAGKHEPSGDAALFWVFVALLDLMADTPAWEGKVEELARQCSRSVRTVRTALGNLEELGYLTRGRRGRRGIWIRLGTTAAD
jgi:hypothetical protein